MSDDSAPTISNDAPAPEPVRYFGRYRVQRELGRGGMGVVLLVEDMELARPVALKLLPDEIATDAMEVARLKSEVLRGMKLTHPGIVRVHHFERDARHAGIVMEFVPGETLTEQKLRAPERCFDWVEIERWIEQLCAALDYAHGDAHIVHRDLKPRNLMLTPEGRVKIADFGLAAGYGEALTRSSSGRIVGTPPYMSPQQIGGEKASPADDLYALGATIYELLTSKPPFFQRDIFAQVLAETPPPMAQRRTELGIVDKAPIPRAWERAVAACLAKEPGMRPASGAELLERLRDSSAEQVPVIHIPRPAPKPAPVKSAALPVAETHAEGSSQATRPPHRETSGTGWQPTPRRREKMGFGWLGRAVAVLLAASLAAAVVQAMRHKAKPPPPAAPVAATPTPAPTPNPSRLGQPALDAARGLESAPRR
jgi:serine/threonine protein kinase